MGTSGLTSAIPEELVDYGETDSEGDTIPGYDMDALADMPEGTAGLPWPLLLLAPDADVTSTPGAEKHRGVFEGAVNPEAVRKRARKNSPDGTVSVRVEREITVGQFMKGFVTADQPLFIRTRNQVHVKPPEDDVYCANRWLFLCYVCCFYAQTLGASDPLEAVEIIVTANERRSEGWGPRLANCRLVPNLQTDRIIQLTGAIDTWVPPGIYWKWLVLQNPDHRPVRVESPSDRLLLELGTQPISDTDSDQSGGSAPLTTVPAQGPSGLATAAPSAAPAPLPATGTESEEFPPLGAATQKKKPPTVRVPVPSPGSTALPSSSAQHNTATGGNTFPHTAVPNTAALRPSATRPALRDWWSHLEADYEATHSTVGPYVSPLDGSQPYRTGPAYLRRGVPNVLVRDIPCYSYADAAATGAYYGGDGTGSLPQVFQDARSGILQQRYDENRRRWRRGGETMPTASAPPRPILRPPSVPVPPISPSATEAVTHTGNSAAGYADNPTVDRLFHSLAISQDGLREVTAWYKQGKRPAEIPRPLQSLSFVDVAALEERLKAILSIATEPTPQAPPVNHASAAAVSAPPARAPPAPARHV